MRIKIPIHLAFLQESGNIAQIEEKNERCLSEVLKKTNYNEFNQLIFVIGWFFISFEMQMTTFCSRDNHGNVGISVGLY